MAIRISGVTVIDDSRNITNLGSALTVAQGGTGLTSPGASGNVLTSNGTAWVSSAPSGSGATLSNDTSTNTTQYIGMARATSGAWSTAYVADSKLYFNPSTGTTYSTQFQSLSDQSVKTNVQTIVGAVDTVKALRGVEFNWKDSGDKSSGVIAQELEKILPHLVAEENGIKSVNYMGVIGYLIEAVKELSDRLDSKEG